MKGSGSQTVEGVRAGEAEQDGEAGVRDGRERENGRDLEIGRGGSMREGYRERVQGSERDRDKGKIKNGGEGHQRTRGKERREREW